LLVNQDFRTRVFQPIVLPLLVLLGMAAFIGLVAFTLLYNTHEGALMLAAVAASAILFTVALAASQDRLDPGRRVAVGFAAVVPFAIGGAIAFGWLGEIDDADRNINVQPLVVIPEDAPIIAAENSQDFCIPDNGGCEPADLWEVTPSADSETILFVFDNREAGVPHNVVITELEGVVEDPAPVGEEFLVSELINGPEQDLYDRRHPDLGGPPGTVVLLLRGPPEHERRRPGRLGRLSPHRSGAVPAASIAAWTSAGSPIVGAAPVSCGSRAAATARPTAWWAGAGQWMPSGLSAAVWGSTCSQAATGQNPCRRASARWCASALAKPGCIWA
jgi:hypothetical protein